MKSINCWNDLEPFGIVPLTGEACGLMYRILFDVTEKGRTIVAKCFGIPNVTLPEPWNLGSPDNPHVGSILLTREMLQPLAVFALLESGFKEVYVVKDSVHGFEATDAPDLIEDVKRWSRVDHARRLAYGGTAGDRNIHVMSGRVD